MIKKLIMVLMCGILSLTGYANTVVSEKNIKSCYVPYQNKTHFIKLHETNEIIGRVEYNSRLKKYVSFAFFPFQIQYQRRRAVQNFLAELTKYSVGIRGKYYIDMSSGEVGYYEITATPQWLPRELYKIWPEISRIVKDCARTSTVMKTIQMFPLKDRTHGNLSLMKEIEYSDLDPGEFVEPGYSVEEELELPEKFEKKHDAVIDRKKIMTDFNRLIADDRLPDRILLR